MNNEIRLIKKLPQIWKKTSMESLKRVLPLDVWAVFRHLSLPDESLVLNNFQKRAKMFSHLYSVAFRKFVCNA